MDYTSIPSEIRAPIESSNERVLSALVEQLRSPLGVIPFIGAGISAPLKYLQWGDFLTTVAAQQLGQSERLPVQEALDGDDFLRAADLLGQHLGEEDFHQIIAEEFSDARLQAADLASGLFGYLPLLASGPVITTNFDRVVEHVFERAGQRFKETVLGANPRPVISAIQQNHSILWKIHGDRADHRTRVFSDAEYDKHYKDLAGPLLVAFVNRPALFVGCSLEQDRTTRVLDSVRATHPTSRHFAFQQIPETVTAFDERRLRLRKMGVRPVWYIKDRHEQILELLADVLRRVSSIRRKNSIAALVPAAMTLDQGLDALSREISDVRLGHTHENSVGEKGGSIFGFKTVEVAPYPVILDLIARGRLAFFLGAGASLGKLPLGRQFYDDLIQKFGRDSTGDDPARRYGAMPVPRVTQHFADKLGRAALDSHVKSYLATTLPDPTAIHWFVVMLQHRLQSKGIAARAPWIFTTNCDDWIEHALRSVGLRFHLFSYRPTGDCAGSFVYQSPDGAVDVIDRPRHFRRLGEPCIVVVKYHGGVHRYIDMPVSYVYMQRDFVQLAGRVPDALPWVVRERMAEDSFLFLGSGLGDDSLDALVREIHAGDSRKRSWAVMLGPRPETPPYWQQLGVDVIDTSLEVFVQDLSRRVDEIAPPIVGART